VIPDERFGDYQQPWKGSRQLPQKALGTHLGSCVHGVALRIVTQYRTEPDVASTFHGGKSLRNRSTTPTKGEWTCTNTFDQHTSSMESPLPVLESPQFQELGLHESLESVSAYRKILHAEAEANADEEVVLARVVGYLLLELHARRHVLGNKPYERIVDELVSPTRPIDNEDELVFECGQRYRDILIRGCEFAYSFVYSPVLFSISVVLKLGRLPSNTPHLPHTPRVLPMITY